METEESKIVENGESASGSGNCSGSNQKLFTLKKWNAVAMWSWDVECDTCAICRVQVMDACLRCQSESKVIGHIFVEVLVGVMHYMGRDF